MVSMSPALKRRVLVGAKILVSFALLGFLFVNYDSTEVRQLLVGIDGIAFLVALLLGSAGVCLAAVRWSVVLRVLGIAVQFPEWLKLTYVGAFFNQLLPSSVGGDVVRVWHLSVAGERLARAVLSVLLDRVLALVALAVMILGGMPWLFDVVSDSVLGWALLGATAAVLGGLVLLLSMERLLILLRRVSPRFANALAELSESARALFLKPGSGLVGLLLSLMVHGAMCAIVFTLARGLGYELDVSTTLFLVPPVIFASVVPISIGGWGVREGAMVIALGFAGIPAEASLAISILFGLTLVAASLPGGVMWLMIGGERRVRQ